MEGVKTIGQDASFDSNLCWVWWPGKAAECGGDNAADCIDGKVGFVTTYGDSGIEDNAGIEEQETKATPMSAAIISQISTLSLMNLNMEILAKCSSNILEENDVPPAASLTLVGMRLLKRRVSLQYEHAKDDLFRHRVFREWSCRDCGTK